MREAFDYNSIDMISPFFDRIVNTCWKFRKGTSEEGVSAVR